MTSARRGTPDFLLLFLTFLLVCFGLAMVFSASYYISTPLHYLKTQAIAAGVGTAGMILAMNVHYTKLRKLVLPMFAIIVGLLIVVLFSQSQYGAKSWINLGPFNLQPTEFAKIGIVLYMANLISKKEDKFRSFKTGLLPALIVLAAVVVLILLQPDFGSCMILLAGTFLVILVGGANLKHLFLLAFSGVSALALGLAVYVMINGIDESLRYKWARVTSFLNPWSADCQKDDCYQIVQSLYAFGHGGITGAGFGQGIQKLQYLPKAYNDFIFAIIGEEFGFIGATMFLLVYLLFIWRGIIVAVRCPDSFGTLTGIGIMGMIALQALINLGGVTSSIPMTGVTLPLISYGGSSIMATLISLGILLGISREQSLTAEKETRPKTTKKPSVPL